MIEVQRSSLATISRGIIHLLGFTGDVNLTNFVTRWHSTIRFVPFTLMGSSCRMFDDD